jgi:2,3-bisphosphoglycerate-dependent phosphoglycerate mutase
MPRPVTFLLVRHGETAWNREGRIQGQGDSALTARGVAQARAAAARVAAERPHLLYSSDLGRAVETARQVSEATGLAARLEPGLRERRYGIFEGKTWPEIERDHPADFARHAARDPEHEVPGGESPEQLRERVVRTLERIARDAGGERIAIVTHGGVLDVVYREVMGIPLSAPRAHALLNATLKRLRLGDGGWELERWGEADHLADAALDDSEV